MCGARFHLLTHFTHNVKLTSKKIYLQVQLEQVQKYKLLYRVRYQSRIDQSRITPT